MPKIREFCSQGKIEEVKIITSKANVSILKNTYDATDMDVSLIGTLYYWKVSVEQLKGV